MRSLREAEARGGGIADGDISRDRPGVRSTVEGKGRVFSGE
jgi:hypothetical protein